MPIFSARVVKGVRKWALFTKEKKKKRPIIPLSLQLFWRTFIVGVLTSRGLLKVTNIEVVPSKTNDYKEVNKILKENIYARFGI